MKTQRWEAKTGRPARRGTPGGDAVKRLTRDEARLVREARGFMHETADVLARLLAPSRELRVRLAQTDAYKRVDGLDVAQEELVWDLAGVLESCFEPELENMIVYLRDAARRAGRRQARKR